MRTLWVGCIAASAILLTAGFWNWSNAGATERTKEQRLAKATASAKTIADLTAALPSWATSPKPAGPLAPEISAVLASSGLPASAMNSLSAESEAPSLGPRSAGPVQARTRRATLVLTSVTLPQVGTFLDGWRTRQPAWTISAIELSPELGAEKTKAATGGDLPLRAVLTLETISLDLTGVAR